MRARLEGIRFGYTDEGDGYPLVFLHGFPLNRNAWSKQVAAFKPDWRVLAPDLRGLGESMATPGPVAMATYAEDVHALLAHLGAEPAILVGHSMGGYVALAFAKAHPEALRGLVLVGTRGGPDSPEASAQHRAMADKVAGEGTTAVLKAMAAGMLSTANTDEAMAASVRSFLWQAGSVGVTSALLGMAARPDACPWLGAIQVPTLIIAGEDDAIIPPAEAAALAKAIPGAQLTLIPRAGHLVAFEQAHAFNEVLRTWLGRSDLQHAEGSPALVHLP